jgi:3-oxosteroid 1-dehydrogenase
MTDIPSRWDLVVDVAVVGSGAAALSAAVTAAVAGAKVALLERSDKFGGTTAVSGGVAWVPNNPHMAEVGATDSREDAITYLRRLSLDRTDERLIAAFVDHAPEAVRFLEAQTPLRFVALKYPDYHPEFPGGKRCGRSLDPVLFDSHQLGSLAETVRRSPHNPGAITIADTEAGIDLLDFTLVAERMQKGLVAGGNALVSPLIKACADRGVELRREARARRLHVQNGAVVGLAVEQGGRQVQIGARRGVVLASGGFEWNPRLCRDFLRGPLEASASPPFNEGDGLMMAMEVGAALGNMSEAWWMPLCRIPGEEYGGRDMYRITLKERTLPGSIIVNRAGRRFVNEAHNYNDIGRAFHSFDPVAFDFPNVPAWLIFDHTYKSRYPLITMFPEDPIPPWLPQAPTLRALAESQGIDPQGLEATVRRFNDGAARGEDPDFHRGESFYDHYNGDRNREGPLSTLGPVTTPPFYALRMYAGTLGTKGGPRTNERAQVLHVRGDVIPGLYAAGNTMAGVTGLAYGGAGGTIGPALTFGYIAGNTAAHDTNRS